MISTTVNPPRTTDKKDVQKLQRAIIDGLEDVKAQDIEVFDTEHLTPLFERVIVASGTSNRQTKALAASVRDAVREAGFAKPRIEGEANGEWIIVDCGAAVAHIMQPTIRQYYNLEELWGDKPVKLKLGAPAPLVKASKPEVKAEAKPAAKRKPGVKSAVKAGARTAVKAPAKAPVASTDSSYVGRVGKTNDWTAKRNATAPAAEPVAKPAKASAKSGAKLAVKAAPAKSTVRAPARTPIVKVPAAKKVVAKKVVAKTAAKTVAKKPAARKIATKSQ
ncbi:MAG: ribosome silencing factor [Burkholderiales bacterium RIFCSPHIGHO2_12_FULL_61_11]|nr:MAG: ribosome silencing factor [Burkholderiales bacterium RIFCSPHIGHO2_12_FULL_61_11]